MTNTTLHHRQTSPELFDDLRIIEEIRLLLKKNLFVSIHARDKHQSYLWIQKTSCVTKDSKNFKISRLDFASLRFDNSFSALIDKVKLADVFEIELKKRKEVVKIALRVDLPNSPDTDIILVLGAEPNQSDIRLVTWYLNNKNDCHSTLNKKRYAYVR